MPVVNILGAFQDPRSLDQGGAVLVNTRVIPRQAQESKPAPARLVGSPGLRQISKPTSSPCIALTHALDTIWSAHADGSIFMDVHTAAPVSKGSVLVDPTHPIIRFAEDRTALVITTNASTGGHVGTAYTATLTANATNANFDSSINFDPTACAELDNYTLYSGASNTFPGQSPDQKAQQDSKVFQSNPLAPTDVPANQFATKEARADPVRDLAVSGRVLWVLGARSLEQWYNSGQGTDVVFVPYPNSLVSVGIAARLSLAVLRDVIVFVGTDRRLWRCAGQSGQQISQPWIDLLLQELTDAELTSLTAYAYGQGGSDFYVLTLPGKWSLELASTTGAWCYRTSAMRLDHAGRCAVEHDNGVTYVGTDTGEICALDFNISTEPAGQMIRDIVTPWVGDQDRRQAFDSIDITSSMGPAAGPFTLDWSDDRAVTWRGAREVTLPQPGQRRAIGRAFGSGRRRQFRLRYFGSTAPFTIDEFRALVTPGT